MHILPLFNVRSFLHSFGWKDCTEQDRRIESIFFIKSENRNMNQKIREG